MELKVSSPKPGHSPSYCPSDPEEKEVSEGEDEDDDRNHKHRKKETRSQSLERDALDQVLTRPYRKRNKPFENGFQGGGDSARFEKRRPNPSSFSGIDLKYRNRGEVGPGRGRGRELSSWGPRDPRLGSSDIASQLVQAGGMHSSLFPGRGLPNVSNAQGTSWNAYGLVPGLSNGALDALHPLGFQGPLRPSISPMNIVIPGQRCRDFEERGFCLRGDMCPMEHGVNRIVVEDVQSLSQFNLPVSLSGSQLLGTPAGQGNLPAVNLPASSGSLMNGKASYGKSSKVAVTDDDLGLNGGFVGASTVGSDFYDPDQPLWTNDRTETSAALLALNPSDLGETETGFSEGFDDERATRNTANAGSLSVWGRIGSSRNKSGLREQIDPPLTSSSNLETVGKHVEPLNPGSQDASNHGKWRNVNQNGPPFKETSSTQQSDSGHNVRKPSQKALRTLFVKGIPLKDNRKEALLSHFRKFGKIIDIYIPLNSERAFVQFSKREEAEAALMAPDAVMGNRFIKLWWANRDNIPDDGIGGSSNVGITSSGATPHVAAPPHPSAPNKVKENPQSAGGKDNNAYPSVAQVQAHDHSKPVVSGSPRAPPSQNKLASLELLKEELRKKQQMLDQKRNEFRQQLSKLEKHATGVKDLTPDPAAKRLREETPSEPAEAESSVSTPNATVVADKSGKHATPSSSTSTPTAAVQEPVNSRSIRPLAPLGARAPFMVNRFKLDNRPTSFKVVPPLPDGLANVAALEEHFSSYGDLSSVELEESEPQETSDASIPSNITACLSFTTRHSAEKAFLNGKSWQGHNLQFMWITSGNSFKNPGGSGNPSAPSSRPSDANFGSSGEVNSSKNNGGSANYAASSSDTPSDAHIQSNDEAISARDKTSSLGKESDTEIVKEGEDSKSSSCEEQST